MNWAGLDLNNVVLLAISVLVLINTIYSRQTYHNTNSTKDALVKSEKGVSYSEGHDAGRAEGEAKAATLARGRLEGKDSKP